MRNKQIIKQCGSKTYLKSNCNNKIRKFDENQFENIMLSGRHAFEYSVLIENKADHNIKNYRFADRKTALNFFNLSVKKFN